MILSPSNLETTSPEDENENDGINLSIARHGWELSKALRWRRLGIRDMVRLPGWFLHESGFTS